MKFPSWLTIYGNKKYRNKNCPTEQQEQMTFFSTLRIEYPELGVIAYHQRNEGKRGYKQTSLHKAEGMVTGASDIIIPGRPAFICELKREDHTLCKLSPEQIKYLEIADRYKAYVCVALGHKAALHALEDWLKII